MENRGLWKDNKPSDNKSQRTLNYFIVVKIRLCNFLGIKEKQSSIALDPMSFINSTACLRAAGSTKTWSFLEVLCTSLKLPICIKLWGKRGGGGGGTIYRPR